MGYMNVLLVYPECPDTFWGFRRALKFIGRRAAQPPLGLLTVAGMLPKAWNRRLVDMNVARLTDRDLEWADLVFISAMILQKESSREVLDRCRRAGVRTVAGGPLFTTHPEDYPEADHLVLNEAETTLPPFLADLARGEAKPRYTSEQFGDIRETPVPQWDLAGRKHYAAMNIQYSRGCPFHCDFCDIPVLYGRKVRTKTADQLLAELTALYAAGWRGEVFFVDDNFIGNSPKLKRDVLPALIRWMNERGRPFTFQTEASVNLADDAELMDLMVRAGFECVFVGIETPNEESLAECNKLHNKGRDLLACVKAIQAAGLQVAGGFILGFDSDPPTIFDRVVTFVQNSGIVSAMVGLLNAPRHTGLYNRLAAEGRLLNKGTGDNADGTMNFVPRMGYDTLSEGYRRVIQGIYSLRPYYDRVRSFLRRYEPARSNKFRVRLRHILAGLKSTVRLGILGRERLQYWKLCLWALFRRPRALPLAVTFAIYGHHYRKFFEERLACSLVRPPG